MEDIIKLRSERIEVNLNKLYSPGPCKIENFHEYYERLKEQLPSDTRGKNIVITGSGPMWLIAKITAMLIPFCDKISILTGEFEYEIYNATETVLIIRPRKIRRKKAG